MLHKNFFLLLAVIIFQRLQAQVPVRNEPNHKTILENNYVRLLDVHLKPGDTTLYHIHATPSVIVFLSQSLMGAQLSGKKPDAPAKTLIGKTLFVDYGKKPITHRVFNSGENVFHVIDIELVRLNASADTCSLPSQNNIEKTISEQLVNVYTLQLQSGESFRLPKTNCAYLIICADGQIEASKKIKAGNFMFFDAGVNIPLINKENKTATCVLMALK